MTFARPGGRCCLPAPSSHPFPLPFSPPSPPLPPPPPRRMYVTFKHGETGSGQRGPSKRFTPFQRVGGGAWTVPMVPNHTLVTPVARPKASQEAPPAGSMWNHSVVLRPCMARTSRCGAADRTLNHSSGAPGPHHGHGAGLHGLPRAGAAAPSAEPHCVGARECEDLGEWLGEPAQGPDVGILNPGS